MAKNRAAQGKGYEKEVKDILTSEGWEVEQAINKTIFIGPGRIISVAHDFFNLWDIMAVNNSPTLHFIQVTVWEEVSHKIKKIEDSIIDWTKWNCAIYARMRQGRNPHYRVLEAKDNFTWVGGVKMVTKAKKAESDV